MKNVKRTLIAFMMVLAVLTVGSCRHKPKEGGGVENTEPSVKNASLVFKQLSINDENVLKELSGGKTEYIAENVPNDTENVVLYAIPVDEEATIQIQKDGVVIECDSEDKAKFTIPLIVGKNTLTAKVIAKDGSIQKPTITISLTRNTSEEDKKDVGISDYFGMGIGSDMSTIFVAHYWDSDKTTKTYTADPFIFIDGDEKVKLPTYGSLSITPNNMNASVKVSSEVSLVPGTIVTEPKDGAYSIFLSLRNYDNPVTVEITSEDGSVTETYKFILIRDIPVDEGKESLIWLFENDSTKPMPVQFDSETKIGNILIENVSSEYKLTAKAKFSGTKVNFDAEPTARKASKTFDLTSVNSTKIKVQEDENAVIEYTLNFIKPSKDTKLESLTLSTADQFNFEPGVFEYSDIALPAEDVEVTAIPNDSSAVVTINGKTLTENKVTLKWNEITNAENKITVKVTNDYSSKDYVVNVVEAIESGDKVKLKVLVVDSIGGTKVSGTALKVYEAGTTTQIGTDYTVTDGYVNMELDPKKYYDFELIGQKGKWAGSRLENYYIGALSTQSITMYQYVHGQISRDIKPSKIISVKDNSGKPITAGSIIDASVTSIYVEFVSPSGAIDMVDGGGFGAKLGFGAIPNNYSGISGLNTFGWEDTADGNKQQFKFYLENIELPNGKNDLIIVAYDVANNRIEKHINVEFKKEMTGDNLEIAEFTDLFVAVRRTPYSMNVYSTPPQEGYVEQNLGSFGKHNSDVNPFALDPFDGHSSSYLTLVWFELKQNGANVPILGFEMYRRKVGEASFRRVSRTLYGTYKDKRHFGIDSDSMLEEGEEYEYKIVAFNGKHRKESEIVSGKVLPGFTYSLTAPEKNAVLTVTDANNLDYKCTISNPEVLKEENADFISFGLLILEKQGEVAFGARCWYDFNSKDDDGNLTGKPDLRILYVPDPTDMNSETYLPKTEEMSVNQLIADGKLEGITKLDQLITIDRNTGVITFKNAFVKIGAFNSVTGEKLSYKNGEAYQWDIQNWGNNPYSLNDDKPLIIGKSGNSSESHSCGNMPGDSNNAINGKFEFSVKNE